MVISGKIGVGVEWHLYGMQMRRKGEGSGSRLLLCQEFAMGDENFVVQALLSVHRQVSLTRSFLLRNSGARPLLSEPCETYGATGKVGLGFGSRTPADVVGTGGSARRKRCGEMKN